MAVDNTILIRRGSGSPSYSDFTEYELAYDYSGNKLYIRDGNAMEEIGKSYSGGTNLTLSGTTFNVDDAFLKNDANDTTSGTITAAGFTTSGSVSADTLVGSSNNTNTLLFDDDQDAASNMTTLQCINHINVMTDGNNNGTGNFRVYNGSYDVDTADLAFAVNSNSNATFYADVTLSGSGKLKVPGVIEHVGDDNTYIHFTNDRIRLYAGGSLKVDTNETYLTSSSSFTSLSATDDRDFKPNTIDTSGQVRAYFTTLEGMTGSAGSDYQDMLVLDTYSDGTGGDSNALVFDKSTHNIYHYLADQAASTWGTPKRLAYIENGSNNRVMTASSSSTVNGEANLTFDGTSLGVGTASPTSKVHIYNGDGSIPDDANNHLLVEDDGHCYIGIGGGTSSDVGVHFMDSGGITGKIAYEHDNNALILQNSISDGDAYIKVNDGGSTITAIQIDSSESARVRIPNDGQRLSFGADQDMQLSHESNNNYIATYAGNLILEQNTNDADIIFNCDNGSGGVTAYLTLDGSAGYTTAQKTIAMADDARLDLGTGNDFKMWHDSSHNYMQLNNGNLYFRDDGSNNIFTIYREGGGVQLNEGDLKIPATSKLYLDGGGDSFIFEESANNVMFKVGNNNNLRFNSTGAIFNDGSIDLDFRVESNGDANMLFVDGGANRVGIGTGSPDSELHVSNNTANLKIESTGSGNASYLHIKNTTNQYDIYNNAGNLVIDENGVAERFRINSSGKVGIGEDSIDANLHITGSPVVLKMERAGVRALRMGVPNDSSDFVFADSDDLKSNQRLELTGGGDVYVVNDLGVGTASPGTKLHVKQTGSASYTTLKLEDNARLMYLGRDAITVRDLSDNAAQLYINSNTTFSGTVTTNGNVTIGGGGDLILSDSGGGNSTFLYNDSQTLIGYINGAERFRVNSSGNVGIGTTAINGKLTVRSDVAGSPCRLTISNNGTAQSGTSSRLSFYEGQTEKSYIERRRDGSGDTAFVTPADDNPFVFENATGEFLTLINSRVGIRTNNPEMDLHINTTDDGSVMFSRDGGHKYSIEHDTSQMYLYNRTLNKNQIMFSHSGPVTINNDGHSTIDFRVEGDTDTHLIFTDASEDKVGINNSTPYEKLDVKSDSSTSPAIVANGAAANGTFNMAHGYSGANGDYVCTYSTQYSSIGMVLGYAVKASTTASNEFLNSADNSNFTRGAVVLTDTLKFWTAGAQTGTLNNAITMTERFRVTPAGVGHFDNDVVAFSSTVSDKRLKENITTIDNALDKIMALRGVEYDWTATSRKGTHDIGLIAQEVEEVIPELITEHELCTGEFSSGNEKTFKTVNYDKIVGVLIEAIKEQQVQIDELKTKLGDSNG